MTDKFNRSRVYVVYNDRRKDMSDAERYGDLRDVFSSMSKNYDPDKIIGHARRVLSNYEPGDSLLVVGDPVLVGVCMAVLSEMQEEIQVLRWDRDDFRYSPMRFNFAVPDED